MTNEPRDPRPDGAVPSGTDVLLARIRSDANERHYLLNEKIGTDTAEYRSMAVQANCDIDDLLTVYDNLLTACAELASRCEAAESRYDALAQEANEDNLFNMLMHDNERLQARVAMALDAAIPCPDEGDCLDYLPEYINGMKEDLSYQMELNDDLQAKLISYPLTIDVKSSTIEVIDAMLADTTLSDHDRRVLSKVRAGLARSLTSAAQDGEE